MLRKIAIAAAATAALGAAFASAAQAKTNVNLNLDLGLGLGGGYVGAGPVYVGGYDEVYEDDSCSYVKVKHKKLKKDGTVKVWFSKELVCG